MAKTVRTRWFAACLATTLLGGALGAGVARGKKWIHPPPEIPKVSATEVGETSATLDALIRPGYMRTTYEIWISYAPCQGGAGECPKPIQEEKVGGGKLPPNRGDRTVSKTVDMMTPGCTYAYWFVARNRWGKLESAHESLTTTGGTAGPKECSR